MAPKAATGKAPQQAPPTSSRSQRFSAPAGQRLSQTSAFSPFVSPLSNQAMLDLLAAGGIQAKLRVSRPGDSDEVEADRVASRIMAAGALAAAPRSNTVPVVGRSGPALQRKCACSGAQKCSQCEGDGGTVGAIQRQAISQQSQKSSGASSEVVRSLGSGQQLDPGIRQPLEHRFGQDFSRVRIHTGSQAESAAQSVAARAFTFGPNVVFNRGEYSPNSTDGQRLLVHELAHVVQQGAAEPARPEAGASDGVHSSAAPRTPAPTIQRTFAPAIMRTPLLDSTMKICKRVLISPHHLHVTDGGVVVTASAHWVPSDEWKGADRPQCGNEVYEIQLSRVRRIFDDNLDSCQFRHGENQKRNWTNLEEGDYYVTIATNNTNPNCCLEGTIQVEQQKGLTGPSCGGGPARDYGTMSSAEKISKAIEHSIESGKIGGELGTRVKELLTPESIAAMAAFAAAYVISQTTPIGWVADILVAGLIAATVLMVGKEAVDIVQLLIEFFDTATNAKSDSDIDRASELFARALTKAGVDIVVAILFHKAGKAANLKPPGPRSPGLVEVMKVGGGKVMTTLLDPPPALEGQLVTAGGPSPIPPEKIPGLFMMEGEKPGGGSSSPKSGGAGKSGSGSGEPPTTPDKPLPGKKTAAAEGLAKNLPKLREKETPSEQGKESGPQQEQRMLKEDRSSTGGRPANSATYHAYEGGSSGSFRQWAARLRSHVDSVLADSPNRPQINDKPFSENSRSFIDRQPNLKTAWDKMNLSLDTQIKKINSQRSAAAGDKATIRQLDKILEVLEKRRAELESFESGDVGNKRPDLLEVFFNERRAVVTDITQKVGDPLHNFKTEFYVELIKEVLGWTDVNGVNFNTVYDQNITP